MLLTKHLLTVLRLLYFETYLNCFIIKQSKLIKDYSLKLFEKIPDDIVREGIFEYLDVKSLITLGMASKSLRRAIDKKIDAETWKLIEIYGIKEKYGFLINVNDEKIFKELKKFTSYSLILSAQEQDLPTSDFTESLKYVVSSSKLLFPKLISAVVQIHYKISPSYQQFRQDMDRKYLVTFVTHLGLILSLLYFCLYIYFPELVLMS